jgi:beta-glucosidase
MPERADSYRMPPGFRWGAATAAYQIEGAVDVDGRAPSVWDVFCSRLRGTQTGESGAVACDHYRRMPADVALMRDLGLQAYRFSVAWPRIVPAGRGAVNEAGLVFYDRLVEQCLAAGIEPWCTLFHWDSPQALEERYGSWRSREIAQDFSDYVGVVVRRLGDRVRHWMTLNEVPCFTDLGYGVGEQPRHAPGTVVASRREVWQTVHHAMLAHGLAVQAIRAASPRPCLVGMADCPGVMVPWAETPEDIAATRLAMEDRWCNGAVTWPALTGRFSDRFLRNRAADGSMPVVAPGDLATIHQPLDFYGVNVYSGATVRAAANAEGFEVLPYADQYPRLHMPWLQIVPDALYWAMRHIHETIGFRGDLVITENGCAADDKVKNTGEVQDLERILYMRSYLRQAHRLVNEGYPLTTYFAWSLMDNFEWSWGYARRFGLVHVNYETQERIPKLSARWYAACIRQHRIV